MSAVNGTLTLARCVRTHVEARGRSPFSLGTRRKLRCYVVSLLVKVRVLVIRLLLTVARVVVAVPGIDRGRRLDKVGVTDVS